jgi:hypothetical protein
MEWEAENFLEPIGEQRADYRMAVICSTVTNLAGYINSKKGQWKPVKPQDFMPKWDSEGNPEKQSVEDMKEFMMGMVRASRIRQRAPLDRPPRSLRARRTEKKRTNTKKGKV